MLIGLYLTCLLACVKQQIKHDLHLTRHQFWNLAASSWFVSSPAFGIDHEDIRIPLEAGGGGTLAIRLRLYSQTKNKFQIVRAIVDTGSPYLVFTNDNTRVSSSQAFITSQNMLSIWSALLFQFESETAPRWFGKSQYRPTEEVYGTIKGYVDWKSAYVDIPRAQNLQFSSRLIVGLLDYNLTEESGGPLFGLIRYINPSASPIKYQPRPTVLGQFLPLNIRSFCLDAPNRMLTLSTRNLIQSATKNTINLVDLRPLGDFVDHYAVLVHSFVVDRNPDWTYRGGTKLVSWQQDQHGKRPVVAVFDTGLTGCVITRALWDELQSQSSWPSPSEYKYIQLRFKNNSADEESFIESGKDSVSFYVAPIDLDWFDNDENSPHVVVLGQAFLGRGVLIIDTVTRYATFSIKS